MCFGPVCRVKQHHLHPFQARQVVAHALHSAEGDRRRTGAQPRLRLHPLAGLEHQRHHAVQPRDVPAEVLGLAQRQLQLTCDFRIAWNLGFERAAHAKQMRHSLHAINGKLGSGPRVVVHGHVRLNHVVGMVCLQVRPVHLSAVAGGKHHRVVGPLGVQRREQLSLGFGARVKASRELASAFLKKNSTPETTPAPCPHLPLWQN